MIKVLFILIQIFFAIQIFFQPRIKKLPWFFAGILFFPLNIVVISNPYTNFPRFLILVFFVSSIFAIKNIKRELNGFVLRFPFLLVFVSCFLIGIADSRIDFVSKLFRPLFYFFENFLAVFLTYYYVKSLEELKRVYNCIVICFIVFGVYGIINYVSGVSLYTSFIAETYNTIDFGNRYTISGDSRFRVVSFAWHPIYYGLLLSFAILLIVFIYYEKKMKVFTVSFYMLVLMLLSINLILTNSRTPLIALFIGLSFFYLFAIKIGNKLRIALIGVIIVFSTVSVSPEALKLVDETINTFTSKGSKLEGSSFEMREAQLAASIIIFNKSPYFGNGFNFISEDLGFSSDKDKSESNSDFAGFESYIYKLLIEQGSIGIFANLYFFIFLFRYLFKTRSKVDLLGQKLIYLSVSMTITFLIFIIGTGDMGAFMVFMALLGINLKGIQLSLNKKNSKNILKPESKFISL